MKNILCLLVVFSIYTTVSSQNSLTGNITSKNTNEPVPSTIYIPQLEKGTVADFDGNYTIINIPDGSYNIVFSSLGFATISKRINFSNGKSLPKILKCRKVQLKWKRL